MTSPFTSEQDGLSEAEAWELARQVEEMGPEDVVAVLTGAGGTFSAGMDLSLQQKSRRNGRRAGRPGRTLRCRRWLWRNLLRLRPR